MYRILLAFLLLLPLTGQSQATYVSDDFAVEGDTFQLSIATSGLLGIDFDATGADYSWDFSNLGYDNQTVISFIDPNDGGYKLTWCLLNGYILNCNQKFDELTNLGLIDGAGNPPIDIPMASFTDIVNHHRVTTDALELTMIGSTIDLGGFPLAAPFEYTFPDTIVTFPIEYGGSSSTYSEFELDLNPLGVDLFLKSTGTRNNTVDGWGSLETPFGSYPSTIRVNSQIERNDTIIFSGFPIPVASTQIEIRWFDPEFGYPILQANGISVGGFSVITEVRYLDTVQCFPPSVNFFVEQSNVWNPDIQASVVDFSNLSGGADSFEWNFGDGSISNETDPSHTYLCPGTYDVVLTATAACAPNDPVVSETTITVADSSGYFESTFNTTICQGDSILLGDEYQSSTGTYVFTLPSQAGCDSTVTAILAVSSINTNVMVDDMSLSADMFATSYQWVNCENGNSPIAGATEQTFFPSVSGSYAVEITENGCTATSDCYEVVIVGTNAPALELIQIDISPNPFVDQLALQVFPVLKGQVLLEIVDPLGRIVFAERQEGLDARMLDLSTLPAGMYWLRIRQEKLAFTKAILKQ
ncbi:MAG: PKD domain-containing protein [Saprospiraceae bacterium]|nr:PKD domain-containing protein [Saprospiraceae bacterium]